jgi:hypothetical protein
MSIEFEQENNFNQAFNRTISKNSGSKMNSFLIKHYIAKNEQQANMILLGISVLCIITTAIIMNVFIFGNRAKPVNNPNAAKIEEYRKQGLTGKALFDKIQEDRKAGIIK